MTEATTNQTETEDQDVSRYAGEETIPSIHNTYRSYHHISSVTVSNIITNWDKKSGKVDFESIDIKVKGVLAHGSAFEDHITCFLTHSEEGFHRTVSKESVKLERVEE